MDTPPCCHHLLIGYRGSSLLSARRCPLGCSWASWDNVALLVFSCSKGVKDPKRLAAKGSTVESRCATSVMIVIGNETLRGNRNHPGRRFAAEFVDGHRQFKKKRSLFEGKIQHGQEAAQRYVGRSDVTKRQYWTTSSRCRYARVVDHLDIFLLDGYGCWIFGEAAPFSLENFANIPGQSEKKRLILQSLQNLRNSKSSTSPASAIRYSASKTVEIN